MMLIQELIMKVLPKIFGIVIVGMIMIGALSEITAADKKITKKNVPAVVLKAFADSYPKAKVNAYLIEIEKGEKCYELETVDGSLRRDLLYRSDGSVAEIEEILTPKTVPRICRPCDKNGHAESENYQRRKKH